MRYDGVLDEECWKASESDVALSRARFINTYLMYSYPIGIVLTISRELCTIRLF